MESADLTTLELAYDDARTLETKYKIAVFASNLAEEADLSEAEQVSVRNMELEQGILDDSEEPDFTKFEKRNTEGIDTTSEEMKLTESERAAYDDARNRGKTPYAALKHVFGGKTVETVKDRQENGHPLDR